MLLLGSYSTGEYPVFVKDLSNHSAAIYLFGDLDRFTGARLIETSYENQ
jgi:hypothetical protein